MWFYSDRDPKKFMKAVWFIGKWMLLGPVIAAALLGVIGFLVAGSEGFINGIYIGLTFGAMGGVMTAGSRALSRLSD